MKIIPLTKGYVAWVDDCDYETVSRYKWHALNPNGDTWYAVRSVWKYGPDSKRKMLCMHREIMNAPEGVEVDHRVHEPEPGVIDNRRSNLRLCTRRQNMGNQRLRRNQQYSCFKGVTWDRSREKWMGRIQTPAKLLTKRFETELEAAKWYDEQAPIIFGEFALTNFSGPNAIYASLPLSPSLDNSPEPW